MIWIVTAVALTLACAAWADDDAQRDKLTGSWQVENANPKEPSAWLLERSADAIHMTASNGGKTVAEFNCKTGGEECQIKDGGHRAKVTMWFNGPRLVETETIGSRIFKRRFEVTADGTLEVETIPVEPDGKSETLRFKRVH